MSDSFCHCLHIFFLKWKSKNRITFFLQKKQLTKKTLSSNTKKANLTTQEEHHKSTYLIQYQIWTQDIHLSVRETWNLPCHLYHCPRTIWYHHWETEVCIRDKCSCQTMCHLGPGKIQRMYDWRMDWSHSHLFKHETTQLYKMLNTKVM